MRNKIRSGRRFSSRRRKAGMWIKTNWPARRGNWISGCIDKSSKRRLRASGTDWLIMRFRERRTCGLALSIRSGRWSGALDFNVHPMCSVLLQQTGEDTVQVLDEMVLPNANTLTACEELLRRTEAWRRMGTVTVDIYGDASGYQRRTSGTATDWTLIREFFQGWTGQFATTIHASRANPGVRDRVNVVNSRLCSASGERRLLIDPRCRELVRDLERVQWQSG